MPPSEPAPRPGRTLGLACLAGTAAIVAFVVWAAHFRDRRAVPTPTVNAPTAPPSPPAYAPPPVADPALAEFVDRRAPIGDRVKPDQPTRPSTLPPAAPAP
jgi:hypothetical protein